MEIMENKQLEIHKRYLKMAFIWATNSKATRLKVGALLVKNNAIISDGYNGTPSGFSNCCEKPVDEHGNITEDEFKDLDELNEYVEIWGKDSVKTKPEVLHAESNAITKIARSAASSEGATMYITDAPCFQCSKLIIQSGIKEVVYARSYRDESGINLLRKAGVTVTHVPIDGWENLISL